MVKMNVRLYAFFFIIIPDFDTSHPRPCFSAILLRDVREE